MAYELGKMRTDRGEFIDRGNYAVDPTHPDFGADPTGKKDSRAALAAADTEAVALGMGLVLRPGAYLVGTNLTLTSKVDVHDGASFTGAGTVTYTKRGVFDPDALPKAGGNLTGDVTSASGVKISADLIDEGGAVFNVMHPTFGATGDGTTDDRAAIQAAIDAASTAGGGAVLIPEGTFALGSALALASGVDLVGVGQGSILKRLTNTAYALAEGTGISRFAVRNLRLTGSATATVTGAYGIRMVNCTDGLIENNHISGQPGDGIGCDSTASSRIRIRGNTVTGSYGHGIQFTSGMTDMEVEGNIVHAQLGGGYGYVLGYTTSVSPGAKIRGNTSRANAGSGGYQINGLVDGEFIGNISDGNKYGIVTSSGCLRLLIANNVITDSSPDATINAVVTMDGISESLIQGNLIAGITGGFHGIRILAGSVNNTFQGNHLRGDGAGHAGFWVEANTNTLIGNSVSKFAEQGITVWGGNNCVVIANRVEGNATAQILLGNGPDGSTVSYNEVSNIAVAGTNPPGIDISANTANCRVIGNIIHTLGSGTRINLSPTGTSTTLVRDDTFPSRPTYTASNVNIDRTYDGSTVTLTELADVVASIIADLRDVGILG